MLEINGQQIPWSFFGLVSRKCGGKYQAERIFWRFRNKQAPENATQKEKDTAIIRYISKGIKEGWINKTTSEEDYTDKNEIQEWVDEVFGSKKKKVESLGDILRNLP